MGRACAEERSGRTRANSYFVNSARSWFWGNSGAAGVDSSSGLPSSAARFLLVPTWRVMITITFNRKWGFEELNLTPSSSYLQTTVSVIFSSVHVRMFPMFVTRRTVMGHERPSRGRHEAILIWALNWKGGNKRREV